MLIIHFLIVDDEAMARRTLAREIRAAHPDCTITETGSGEQALQMLKDGGFFNIIVSDNSMPGGMRGIQFLHEVRERLPRSVRILVSGDQERAEIARAVSDKVIFAAFDKPWNSDEFQTVIHAAVSRIVYQETVRFPDDRPPIAFHDDDDSDAASPYDPADEVDPWAD